ncbi:MAG: sulfatase-like hydrolase/transferase [Candidatus Latescibacterota bacterium]|nr:sulfatase-like hydrolase/transferase [Candidatus Latescibacterota bacterium]
MAKRPNILWVSFEDCYPYFGCYGDQVARTSYLDRLAAEGGVWTRAFSTAPVCSPARSGVITGMYPVSIGTHHHRTGSGKSYDSLAYSYEAVIPHYVKCFSEYLRGAGYYCSNNAKTDYQFAPPVTAWDDCSASGHWRNRLEADDPFFAVFNLAQTHESNMWEEKDGEPIWPELSFELDAIEVPPYFPDTKKVRESLARNYMNIEYNDRRLGELLGELEEDGLSEDTIVFIWTDHGPMPRGKRWPYDSGIRSPLIVRWPGGLEPGTVSEELVSTVDLAPTVLSLCGVEIPQHIQGRAFLGAKAEAPRDYVYAARDRFDEMYDTVRAVRDQRFKYIRHYHPEKPYMLYNRYRNIHPIMQEMWRLHAAGEMAGPAAAMLQGKRPAEELFDTEADPHEIENLAADPAYAGELARLRSALDEWQREVGDLGLVPEDIMYRQMYPDGEQPQTLEPLLVVLGGENYGLEESPEGGEFKGPVILQMQSSTQGASIAYTLAAGDNSRWLLYHEPIRLPEGKTRVRAQAIRIGYRPSGAVDAIFTVR